MTFSALPADDCKRSSDASRTAMARLLAVAGHDLKQPLQVALMSMAGAVRDGVDSRTEQRIGTAMEALIRLECELDDIVLSSRTEHGPFPLRIKVQLGVVLDQVRSDWQLHADTCGIDIRFETPTFAADTDPRMLRTILRNLVGNVINYTSAGGHVTVACSRMADDIVIEVRDDGCGIASSRLDSVFEAFDRGGRTDRTTGSGLGLQIVQETADILQHRVSVRSIEGEGTTFTVVLPAWKS